MILTEKRYYTFQRRRSHLDAPKQCNFDPKWHILYLVQPDTNQQTWFDTKSAELRKSR